MGLGISNTNQIEQILNEYERKLQRFDKETKNQHKNIISERIQQYLNISYGGKERDSYTAHKLKKKNDKKQMVHDLKGENNFMIKFSDENNNNE